MTLLPLSTTWRPAEERGVSMAQPPISRHSLKARCGALSGRKPAKAKKASAESEYRDIYRRPEQSLTMLLAEPEIQMLMQADRVNVQNLIAELNVISAQLRRKMSSSPPMNLIFDLGFAPACPERR